MFVSLTALLIVLLYPGINCQKQGGEGGGGGGGGGLPWSNLTELVQTSQCARDLVSLYNGEYPHSFKIISSTGKQLNHIGNFDDCVIIPEARFASLIFDLLIVVRFCMLSLHSTIPEIDGTPLGVCVPRSCGATELTTVC